MKRSRLQVEQENGKWRVVLPDGTKRVFDTKEDADTIAETPVLDSEVMSATASSQMLLDDVTKAITTRERYGMDTNGAKRWLRHLEDLPKNPIDPDWAE